MGILYENWKFPDCVHFIGAWDRQAVIETIAVVYENTKELRRCVRRLGTIIQSFFCAQSGAGIRLNFWKWANWGLQGDLNPWPRDTGQLSYEATGVGSRSIMCSYVPLKDLKDFPQFTRMIYFMYICDVISFTGTYKRIIDLLPT